jgi:hypothetical protein
MSRPRTRPLLGAAALGAALSLPAQAVAQTGEQVAAAEALFREGKELMSQGREEEACAKFAASHKLDPAVGTLLNLADCNERIARTASAWAQFLEAETLSRSAGSERRERVARERAAALEPALIRLTVVVPEQARVEGLTVTRDEQVIEPAGWGSGLPVDPGEHVVVAKAPGKLEWRTTVSALEPGARLRVTIPALEDLAQPTATPQPAATSAPPQPVATGAALTRAPAQPRPEPQPVASADSPDAGSAQRAIGLMIGGVGLAGYVVGSVFGLSAKSKWSDADCPQNVCQTSADQQLSEDANRNADIATVTFIAATAALTLGTVVYLTAPRTAEHAGTARPLAVAPVVGRGSGAIAMAGRF